MTSPAIFKTLYQRVFQIQWNGATGSCFTMEVEGRQYICTAKHCVEGFGSGDQLQILKEGDWHTFSPTLVGYGTYHADICVLAVDFQLSPSYGLNWDSAKMGPVQEVYFLGFPYGWHVKSYDPDWRYPKPLVKRGTLSGTENASAVVHYIDGHNNPGFSGGPVVYTNTMPGSWLSVAAVISGFMYEPEPIVDQQNQSTVLRYLSNTGIIVAYDIRHALEAVRSNPIGYELNESWRFISGT